MAHQELPKVSVVIPVKRSQATIRETVESLARQDYQGPVELILVGDPGDPTWGPIWDLIDAGRVTAIEVTLNTRGRDANAKRNIGLERASGEVLSLTDSDMVLPPNWIASGVQLIQDGWQCVAGPMEGIGRDFWSTYSDLVDIASKTPRFYSEHIVDRRRFGRRGYKPPITANVFFSHDVYERVGGLDSTFVYDYEDYQWFWEIAKADIPMLCTPMLKAAHHHRQNVLRLVREYARSGRGCADFVLAYPNCPLSWIRLAQLGGVLVAPLGLLFPQTALLIASVGVAILGVKNALRAQQIRTLFFPLITLLLGLAFSCGMVTGLILAGLGTYSHRARQASLVPERVHAAEPVRETP